MFNKFCCYCETLYGGSHEIQETKNGKFLIIKNEYDRFKINLSDKVRFGKFSLYHRNYGRLLDGRYVYHVQCYTKNLSYAIYISYTHTFNKSNKIFSSSEDYNRFMIDWKRYLQK